MRLNRRKVLLGAFLLTPLVAGIQNVSAQPLDMGVGTIDPLTIPKYVTPLVIPPVMKDASCAGGTLGMGCTNGANDYDIAVRQFMQQILPGGIWNTINGRTDAFPATTVWSYGPAKDPLPDSLALGGGVGVAPATNSQFNYPAYTIENTSGVRTTIDWINDLTTNAWDLADGALPGDALPHLLAVDQTLHWANPKAVCEMGDPRTDCAGDTAEPYTGPVPIVTHVHGAHVGGSSDGYTEAWWLPSAQNINCVDAATAAAQSTPPNTNPDSNGVWHVVCQGTNANLLTGDMNPGVLDVNTNNPARAGGGFGVGNYSYPNTQPSTTIWYHDHSLGMTRLNVYAGPAGFWLIREADGSETGLTGILPGPAPVAGENLATTNLPEGLGGQRHKYREIPIVIQDRAFKDDGSLFYPDNRAFFEGLNVPGQAQQFPGAPELQIDLDPVSDIAPIWNPEAFFNTMVVNGVTWPKLEVAPAQYRFRLLNGCNSRFLNLALKVTDAAGNPMTATKTIYLDRKDRLGNVSRVLVKQDKNVSELDFYQIGAEQSLKPSVTAVRTGRAVDLAKTRFDKLGRINSPVDPNEPKALLMGLAERADVIVDFRGLPDGTIITMTNTAPDAPFGGFPDVAADPSTTGQVMQFVVNSAHLGASPTDEIRCDNVNVACPLDRKGKRGKPIMNAVVNPATAASNVQDLMVSSAALENFTVANINAVPRELALIEEESAQICVVIDGVTGAISQVTGDPAVGCPVGSAPMAPKAAVLGTVDGAGAFTPQMWADPLTTNVATGDSEQWNLWNFTVDGHPIHVHLVKYKVLGRTMIGGGASQGVTAAGGVEPWEDGWKDTVIAYPGEITSIAATFDIPGLYVWHCHIVEHEDNEMMVPMCVGVEGIDCPANVFDGDGRIPRI